jgi:hypothetical protein
MMQPLNENTPDCGMVTLSDTCVPVMIRLIGADEELLRLRDPP